MKVYNNFRLGFAMKCVYDFYFYSKLDIFFSQGC